MKCEKCGKRMMSPMEEKHHKCYTFTCDNAKAFRDVASRVFKELKEPLRYLEVGVYEGRSLCYAIDEVFSHPQTIFTGVDSWAPPHSDRFAVALRNVIRGDNTILLRLPSQEYFAIPHLKPFDAIHIDGAHHYEGILADLQGAWKALNPGGIILIDDYDRDDYGVRQAVEEFFEHQVPVFRDYSIAYRKPL